MGPAPDILFALVKVCSLDSGGLRTGNVLAGFVWNGTEGTVGQLSFTVHAITEQQVGSDLWGTPIPKRSTAFLGRKRFLLRIVLKINVLGVCKMNS